ncbi:alpha/beta fold hydrolase [Chelatococcus sp. GCM10030263]|uniref:alpha/beta fold hydrolase n=1 Tax=Chelatococcus sp. GCM10030263 TaxID=3273387 RepID=UPI0036132038
MNGQVHYERSGHGQPLVFLHPVGLDGSFWGALPGRCAESFSVVTVDLPGHGRAGPAPRPGDMAYYARTVAELVKELDSGPAILIGLSFGGMIAQNVAVAYPEQVAGLITCGCPGRMPEAAREAILARGREAEAGGMEAVVPATLERWFTPGFRSSPEVEAVRQRLLSDDVSAWSAAWEAISGHDALGALSKLAIPALVVAGDKDAATPLEASQALAAAIPGSKLAVLPGAPHMMQIETADAFAVAVLDFLAASFGSPIRGEAARRA